MAWHTDPSHFTVTVPARHPGTRLASRQTLEGGGVLVGDRMDLGRGVELGDRA